MTTSKPTLEDRVKQFQTLSLPGQPLSMHMGTSYLVYDLWQEVQRLRISREIYKKKEEEEDGET